MKKDRKTLAKLANLKRATDAIGQADLARLANATQQVAKLEAKIEMLRNQILQPEGGSSAPDMLMVNARHRVWIERCLRELYAQNARARVEQEAARVRLAKSNGRTEAIKKLLRTKD
ncbi:MAG: hypothetical protein AAGA08_00900 [Pseudomonadota bacterium]